MQISKKTSRIPAGLVDKSVEFFWHQNEIKCTYNGKTYVFDEFPQYVIDKVLEDMESDPVALKSLAHWENLDDDGRLRQWIFCRFGAFDMEPDIDKNGNIEYTEYFDCGFRGICKHEGKLCRTIKVDHGVLTKTELEILKHVELPDKLIADQLSISIETVSTHWQNIRQKTGKRNKIELAVLANQKGII